MTHGETEVLLGPADRIPVGEGREFVVVPAETVGALDRRIAVFHSRTGAYYATDARCPHGSGPLADGLLGGRTLICPLHGWKFNLETGAPIVGDCPVRVYPVRLTEAGDIAVALTCHEGSTCKTSQTLP
ncbi:MAG: Rieske (2Fe-2S) protein [Capsulimonadaceae bacterium]